MQNERIIELAQKVRDARSEEARRKKEYDDLSKAIEKAENRYSAASDAARQADRELSAAINALPVTE